MDALLPLIPVDKNNKKLVRVKTASYVLSGYRFEINTPEVESTDSSGIIPVKRFHGSDDNTFNHYPQLATLVPRGLSFVTVYRETAKAPVFTGSIRGFRKFTSLHDGDEDTDIACSGLIDPEKIKSADSAVLTTKANGKFVVMNLLELELGGELYLFGGSKSVHRVVRFDHIMTDITAIEHQQKGNLNLLRGIFTAFRDSLASVDRDKLITLMKNNHITGEYEDGKHLVPLPDGKPVIKWFGVISKCSGDEIDIVDALKNLSSCGLPTVEYQILKPSEVNRAVLRQGRMLEGRVIHWCKDGKSIEMEKFKSWWYVVLRVLRTLILNKGDTFFTNYKLFIKERLKERNKDFMKLHDSTLRKWFDLCVKFTEWFISKGYKPHHIDINEESRGMGTVYQEFITENPDVNDDIYDTPTPVGVAEAPDRDRRLVVIVQGVPGIGKNTVALEVVKKITDIPVYLIDQDSFVKKHGKSAGAECFKTYEVQLLTQTGIIMVLRNNADVSQYGKYVEAAGLTGWKTLLIEAADVYTDPALLFNVCANAVLERACHPSFDKLSDSKKVQVVISFLSLLLTTSRPVEGKQATFVRSITWLNSALLSDSVRSSYDSYIKSGNGFGIPEKPIKDLLLTDHYVARQFRRSIAKVAEDMTALIMTCIDVESRVVPTIKEPLYIALVLSESDKTELRKVIPLASASLTGVEFLSHVTLMHSSNLNESTTALWAKLKSMKGNVVRITVNRLYYSKETAIFGVDLGDNAELVQSKTPHITGKLPKGIKPVASLSLVSTLPSISVGPYVFDCRIQTY